MTSWVPEACTLPTVEQPLRITEFDALFADALIGVSRQEPGRVRLVLHQTVEERTRELAQRETRPGYTGTAAATPVCSSGLSGRPPRSTRRLPT